jgi:hypothetical protein
VQVGADYAVSPALNVGPYVNVTLGRYSGYSASAAGMELDGDLEDKKLHQWISIGLRGQFNL